MQNTSLYHSIFINQSGIDTIKAGKIYATITAGNAFFVFDENGKKTRVNSDKITWKELDPIVMIVKINSSLLDSVEKGKIYRVFDDRKVDERYIYDENGEKVLFDKIIFNYDLI
jgi:hypothetical protein